MVDDEKKQPSPLFHNHTTHKKVTLTPFLRSTLFISSHALGLVGRDPFTSSPLAPRSDVVAARGGGACGLMRATRPRVADAVGREGREGRAIRIAKQRGILTRHK